MHSRPHVHLCDGSEEEYQLMMRVMLQSGTAVSLNPQKRPNSIYVRSTTLDVARVEDQTFICSETKDEAGPTNNWEDPVRMKRAPDRALYRPRCAAGRCTSFLTAWARWDLLFPRSVLRSRTRRMSSPICTSWRGSGRKCSRLLGVDGDFVKALHSIGAPLGPNEPDIGMAMQRRTQVHLSFPRRRARSGRSAQDTAEMRCSARNVTRLALPPFRRAMKDGSPSTCSYLKLTNPKGEVKYITGAFPSACGKTNLAMLISTVPGWKVETIGDDIAWMKFGPDGRLYAINPEAGFFGVAPGTSMQSNPNAMLTVTKNSIFTNCAITPDGDIWWEA